MFRIAVVSLALVLASGQSSALVCGLRCHARTTTASCHHEVAAARFSVTAPDCGLLTSAVFVRDDTRGVERVKVNAGQVPRVVPSADVWFSPRLDHAAGHASPVQAVVRHHLPPLVLRI
jgi:hypothetical protein